MKKLKIHMSNLQIIALGYLIMIVAGTVLLYLPISTKSGNSPSLTDALFTSTSASCVTGLVLQDTATYWSTFGQAVIMILIQIGGLGFMTIATAFFIMIRRKVGLREKELMTQSISSSHISEILSMTKTIIIGTAIFETLGAAVLATKFIPEFGIGKGIFYSFFHSISAFCNAGFDLMGEKYGAFSSFTAYSNDVVINLTIMVLITVGGLGFLVWSDVRKFRFNLKRYSLHSKIVLSVSGVLTIGGALLFFILEYGNVENGMSLSEHILTSLFSSVTARTAGFNTVDTASLTEGSKLLTMILMMIGGSPGSTAGGVKTTTICVILLYTISGIRRNPSANIFGRRLEDDALKKSVYVLFANVSLAIVSSLIICASQNLLLTDVMFESFSAIGTVGMTTGITRELVPISQYLIIFLMYCGRVGSTSFALALLEKRAAPNVSHPPGKIMVG